MHIISVTEPDLDLAKTAFVDELITFFDEAEIEIQGEAEFKMTIVFSRAADGGWNITADETTA